MFDYVSGCCGLAQLIHKSNHHTIVAPCFRIRNLTMCFDFKSWTGTETQLGACWHLLLWEPSLGFRNCHFFSLIYGSFAYLIAISLKTFLMGDPILNFSWGVRGEIRHHENDWTGETSLNPTFHGHFCILHAPCTSLCILPPNQAEVDGPTEKSQEWVVC